MKTMILSLMAMFIVIPGLLADTIRVPEDIESLGEALQVARDGDVVDLAPGNHAIHDNQIVELKSLDIIGRSDADRATVIGEGTEYLKVEFFTQKTILRNIDFKNIQVRHKAIGESVATSAEMIVEKCRFERRSLLSANHYREGKILEESKLTVLNCLFDSWTDSVSLTSSVGEAFVAGCEFVGDQVVVWNFSNSTVFKACQFESMRSALKIHYKSDSTITDCHFVNCDRAITYHGIRDSLESTHSRVEKTSFSHCATALLIEMTWPRVMLDLDVRKCDFVDCFSGIRTRGADPELLLVRLTVGDSNFRRTHNALSLYDAGSIFLIANLRNCWWGSVSGPTHDDNPTGYGSRIYDPDGVIEFDDYAPWLDGPVRR